MARGIEVPCRNGNRGCTRMLTVDNKISHERSCEWRPVRCPYHHNCPECERPLVYNKWSAHMTDYHECTILDDGRHHRATIPAPEWCKIYYMKRCAWKTNSQWFELAVRSDEFVGDNECPLMVLLRKIGSKDRVSTVLRGNITLQAGSNFRQWDEPLSSTASS